MKCDLHFRYYAAYRAYSHYKALKGARTLLGLFTELDASQAARISTSPVESKAEDSTPVGVSPPACLRRPNV